MQRDAGWHLEGVSDKDVARWSGQKATVWDLSCDSVGGALRSVLAGEEQRRNCHLLKFGDPRERKVGTDTSVLSLITLLIGP